MQGISLNKKSIAAQPDYILQEEEVAESADEIRGPLSTSFRKRIIERRFFPFLKEKLRDLPPFFRDTQLAVNFRTFDFERDNSGFFDPDGSNDNRAWAIGGAINYKSGYLLDRVALVGSYYTSQKITGSKNEDGTLLLAPEQKGFDVLGQSYVEVKLYNNIDFRAYRTSFNIPYLNRQDSRMVPNTHEAYVIRGLNVSNTSFIAGYVNKMKTRNSDSFKHMSVIAGAPDTDDGLVLAGARYRFDENMNIGALNLYSSNIMNIFYTEANMLLQLSENIPLKVSAQFTDQRSIGDELITDFNTRTGGAQASISYGGAVLTVAATTTADNSGIRSPYGGRPSYLSIAIKDFDRADEDAWLVGLSYDFKHLGFEGLTAFTNYARGYTPDSGSKASPDQTEWDITVDYRPRHPLLQGLWFRYRRAVVDQDGTGEIDQLDNRLILNWEIPLL